MAGMLKLRALVGFYRVGPDGRFIPVRPGEVFRASLAEAADLLCWQRAEPADPLEAAKFNAPQNDWRRIQTRDAS